MPTRCRFRDLHADPVDQHAARTGTAVHAGDNVRIAIASMPHHHLGEGLVQKFVTVLFLLAVGAGNGFAIAALDFTIDNGAVGHWFRINLDDNLATATVMVNLHVFDAVMANIYADSLALTANSS